MEFERMMYYRRQDQKSLDGLGHGVVVRCSDESTSLLRQSHRQLQSNSQLRPVQVEGTVRVAPCSRSRSRGRSRGRSRSRRPSRDRDRSVVSVR